MVQFTYTAVHVYLFVTWRELGEITFEYFCRKRAI